MGEGPQQLPSLIGLVTYHIARGDCTRTCNRAEAIVRIAELIGVRELLAMGHFMIGTCAMSRASFSEALSRISRVVEIVSEIDFPRPETSYDIDLISVVHENHAMALVECGKPDQALEAMRASRERAS